MKVLVIDDNIAICEALKELLTEADMTVDIVNNLDVAAEWALSPNYSFVILDADMFDGNGLKIIDSMSSTGSEAKSNILVICTPGTAIPTDNSYVKEVVMKPFLSTDILEALENIRKDELSNAEKINVTPKKELRTGLFSSKVPKEVVRDLSEIEMEFGTSYVLFQDTAREVYSVASSFGANGCEMCVITLTKDKAMKERFRGNKVETLRLVPVGRDEFLDTYGLGTMFNNVSDFISRSERPVVIIDNLNAIIFKNGMNSALTFIHDILAAKYEKPFSLIVSVNAREFTDKDKLILKSHLKYYTPSVKKK